MFTFACFGFMHLDTAAGTFIVNRRVGNNYITGNGVVIAQIFINISGSNLTGSNSTDYGCRTGYAVAAGEYAFIVGKLTAGECGNSTAFDFDAGLLERTQLNALADSNNDNVAGNALQLYVSVDRTRTSPGIDRTDDLRFSPESSYIAFGICFNVMWSL